jgi:hypothetical protein
MTDSRSLSVAKSVAKSGDSGARRGLFPSALAFGALGRRGFESLSLRQIWRSIARILSIRRPVAAGVALAACAGATHAADTTNYVATALKAPDCITEPSLSFFSQTVQPAEPPHPTLPIGRYYQIVRYLGASSVGAGVPFDFGHFPPTYAWPPYRGMALTGLTVPEPKSLWQRAASSDATMDSSSAFQLHCYDAGSFINTWTFPEFDITGGGPHSIYGYSFDDVSAPLIYDSDPRTDFVLQTSLEIPWFASWPVSSAPPGVTPIGQVNMFAYFRDRTSGKTLALLLGIFDNRFRGGQAYAAFVAHDGATPFASMPIGASTRYATLSPYSWSFSGVTWTGLRFFRAHVTQANFRQVLADVNAYCQAHGAQRHCAVARAGGSAYSPLVTDYEITDFGVIHEVTGSSAGNLSMAVHAYDLGAWNFR